MSRRMQMQVQVKVQIADSDPDPDLTLARRPGLSCCVLKKCPRKLLCRPTRIQIGNWAD